MSVQPIVKSSVQPRTNARITVAQLADVQSSISELGYAANASYVLLADLDGQDVAYWCRLGDIDSQAIAALAVGDFLAGMEIGATLGGSGKARLVIQEHDGNLVLMMWVPTGHILLVAKDMDSSLGYVRLTMRRACDEISTILSANLVDFPRPALVAEFERALLRSNS